MRSKEFFIVLAVLGSASAGASPALAGGTHGGAEAPVFSFGAPGKPDDVTRTVAVKAGDMTFDIGALRIRDGETIRFVVSNVDEVDHDFTIGPPKLQAEHRAAMAELMAGGHGMAMMHKDPNALYLKPGETKELIWTFRNVAQLEYACNVPGHYESGMHGRLRVESEPTGSRQASD